MIIPEERWKNDIFRKQKRSFTSNWPSLKELLKGCTSAGRKEGLRLKKEYFSSSICHARRATHIRSHSILKPTRQSPPEPGSLWQDSGSLFVLHVFLGNNRKLEWPLASTLRDHKEGGLQRKPAKAQLANCLSPGRREKQINQNPQSEMSGGWSVHLCKHTLWALWVVRRWHLSLLQAALGCLESSPVSTSRW